MTKTTQNAIVIGSTYTLTTKGIIVTVLSIKGRWVKVATRTGEDFDEMNVAAKDLAPVSNNTDGASTERKNGVVNAKYLSRYTRVKLDDGTSVIDNGDDAAVMLRGMSLDEIYKVVARKLGVPAKDLKEKYAHLNPGMAKMNCANRLRKALRDADRD